ncbi:peptidoglycan recognition protein family protein [Nocardia miyunensis]|uniref:peptidoglycan recognition protein family protein n=1 Tax=Nocardia miyunensis TaxID=282684 RepID=UPI001FE218F7|nr:peptidoglycan recognition family protein [Nocardia miyunensis]
MSEFQADVTILSPNDGGTRDPSKCQLIVIHTNEGPPTGSVAGLLQYLANPAVEASYTVAVGGDGTIGRSNDDNYVPWAAGSPANERGLHLCLLGYASQSRADWLSRPAQLDAAARVLRDWHDRYGIPLVKITGAQMAAGVRGVGGHKDTVDAWHATNHTDPGSGFPYDVLLAKATGGQPVPDTSGEDDTMPSAEDIATAVWGHRIAKPDGQSNETAGNLLSWVDKHAADQIAQSAGPESEAQRGPLAPTGWEQLGKNADGSSRSLVDGVAHAIATADATAAKVSAMGNKLDQLLSLLDGAKSS